MTDHNPFEKPIENTPVSTGANVGVPSAPESLPTGVMVVSIIALLLGVFGLLGTCIGGASLLASESLMGFLPEEAQEATKNAMEIQFVPGMVQLVTGLLLSVMLVVAAIGCLTRKPSGAGLMRISMIGCVLNSLLGIGLVIWMTLFHADTLAAVNSAQGMSEEQGMQMFYATQIFTIVFVAALMCFYAFGAYYFGKQNVTDFFDRQSQLGR